MVAELDRRPDALGTLRVLPDETLCRILSLLTAKDVGRLACVSSIFNVFCNEEPLWMYLCLQKHRGRLDYKGTWKQTALAKNNPAKENGRHAYKARHFRGFNSLFLYRRWYRCHVGLDGFAKDNGVVERRSGLLPAEFSVSYDSKKPVLLTDLVDEWPAQKSWTMDQLVQKCGGAEFKVSQPHGKSFPMKLKDFAAYMAVQHDEEPLYIFDAEFGETAPQLLEDYKVPELFQEDLFSVLSESDRPPYRWLVLGPARSGASWHVDPSLTSAWNTLLCGRKRWALYPPGRVPPGMTLDMDEDDGSINYDGPTSLQWWLDVYPHLNEGDKPQECTQLPGETIYVPSGWWHCVLNIDMSIAVTQNFVNANNLEIVCTDLAPGYLHRAVARAGKVALNGRKISHLEPEQECVKNDLTTPVFASIPVELQPSPFCPMAESCEEATKIVAVGDVTDPNLLLALDALRVFKNEDRGSSTETEKWRKINESVLRAWLRILWGARFELQRTLWNCACLSLDAATWLHRVNVICNACNLPRPAGQDQLPVGIGSNPVYAVGDCFVKLYIQEAGTAASLEVLGSELNFYAILRESNSSLNNVVPEIMASGILYPNDESYAAVPWDGTGEVSWTYTSKSSSMDDSSATRTNGSLGSKKRDRYGLESSEAKFRTKWCPETESAITAVGENDSDQKKADFWPFLVTKRCPGKALMELQKGNNDIDLLYLATSLGKHVRALHTLPLCSVQEVKLQCGVRNGGASLSEDYLEQEHRNVKKAKHVRNGIPTTPEGDLKSSPNGVQNSAEVDEYEWKVTGDWEHFVWYLRKQRKSAYQTLRAWGSLPEHLLQQVETFLPKDPVVIVGNVEISDGLATISPQPVWLHTDLAPDNIVIEESRQSAVNSNMKSLDGASGPQRGQVLDKRVEKDHGRLRIIDFGDVIRGDPVYELLHPFLEIFKLERVVMERFLKVYGLLSVHPQMQGSRTAKGTEHPDSERGYKLSYCAMCYCLLHELDAFSKLFDLRRDLKSASSLEEIAEQAWGILDSPNVSGD